MLITSVKPSSALAVSFLGEGALDRCGEEIKSNKKTMTKALIVTDQVMLIQF